MLEEIKENAMFEKNHKLVKLIFCIIVSIILFQMDC